MISTKDLPPPLDLQPVRRALLSVFDKTGIVPLGRILSSLGVELLSTGGTAKALREAGLPVTDVSEVTGYPELLDGRVKTIHPRIHAGILARRNDREDLAQLASQKIEPIDLIVVNLYPFEQAVAEAGVTEAVAMENVDIGGPCMIRAAAKNYFSTAVVVSPDEYDWVAEELAENDGKISMATRKSLAARAFAVTARYEAAISSFFEGQGTGSRIEVSPGITRRSEAEAGDAGSGMTDIQAEWPETFTIAQPLAQELRYGENPHQRAAYYGHPERHFEKLHGRELSYNNILDLSGAFGLIEEFDGDDPTVVILKHTNPCGVATAATLADAYSAAFATDTMSPFGGIVAVNRPLDMETAEAVDAIFTELIIAPEFEEGVLDFLTAKKNRRLIRRIAGGVHDRLECRSAMGGLLVQERDYCREGSLLRRDDNGRRDDGTPLPADYQVVTRRQPTQDEWADLLFSWRVAKHVKSNAIVYARNRATIGVGAGQMSRIDASEIAVSKGRKSELSFDGCVVASDAFFPFSDGLLAAAAAGATAAIQPGGSVRDNEVIAAADEHGVAMVFTGRRHFKH
ncbi:MAG TPA: bifunctional phosphoribosylaminoimidazolecarboxamide formyltransferase/IMP cyclohydrolase [Rhodothermales bacterium]|nr:bifunctional phosphoribosylaminoimidazolecarboxamide formyltransferase/IMP cyclohydrolase [Rhodothermales bacterium]